MSADAQLRAFIERILRLKEEQDTIGDDIKEIYAEAKGNGYDKTAMGQVVSYLRKRGQDAAKLEEQSAIFDLYLATYDGPVKVAVAAHTPAPARTRENIEEFASREATQSAKAASPAISPSAPAESASDEISAPIHPSPQPDPPEAPATATDAPPPASVATNSKANCLNPDTCKLHFTSALCWQCNDARQKARAA